MPIKTLPLRIGLALTAAIVAVFAADAQTLIDPAIMAKAQAGDAKAQYQIGDTYFVANDTAHAQDAFGWMQKAAAQNLTVAIGELGLFYVLGYGAPVNAGQGLALLNKANAAGDELAADELGVLYFTGHNVPKDPQKAIDVTTRPANDHDPRGEFEHGYFLTLSLNPQDQTAGLVFLRAAAAANNIDAENDLGNLYKNGQIVQENQTQAELYYRQAAQAGDIASMSMLGRSLVADGDPQGGPGDAEAVQWLAVAAKAGDPDAEFLYGYLLQKGRAIAQSDTEADFWYAKAAAQGNEYAERHLGYMTENGYGVPPDLVKADALYTQAAQAGDVIAMRLLGEDLMNAGGTKDAAAFSWLGKAANAGDTLAQTNYGFMIDSGRGTPADPVLAATWYERAAANGNATAQTNLGIDLEQGEGVHQSNAQAAYWLAKAAAQGNSTAQIELGALYYDGSGVQKNLQKAGQLYAQSAAQNNPAGTDNLGLCYMRGDCAPKNYGNALKLFEIAAKQGFLPADVGLGNLYAHGYGVNTNVAYALLWYRHAAQEGNADAQYQLRKAGFAVPAQDNALPATTVVTLPTGDIVPAITGSACAGQGGYGDDTYCMKDGQQIDPDSGEALAQNNPDYIDDDVVEPPEITTTPDPDDYVPAPEPDYTPAPDNGGGGSNDDDD